MPRRRGGRKRKLDVRREPGGQIATPTRRERREDARRLVVERRMTMHGLTAEQAQGQHGGTAAGRALIAGLIEGPDFEALTRYAELRARYVAALAGPAGDGCPGIEREPRGHDNADTSEADRQAMDQWQRAAQVLSEAHPLAHKAVANLSVWDVDVVSVRFPLRCGLDALVALWGLAPRAQVAHSHG